MASVSQESFIVRVWERLAVGEYKQSKQGSENTFNSEGRMHVSKQIEQCLHVHTEGHTGHGFN